LTAFTARSTQFRLSAAVRPPNQCEIALRPHQGRRGLVVRRDGWRADRREPEQEPAKATAIAAPTKRRRRVGIPPGQGNPAWASDSLREVLIFPAPFKRVTLTRLRPKAYVKRQFPAVIVVTPVYERERARMGIMLAGCAWLATFGGWGALEYGDRLGSRPCGHRRRHWRLSARSISGTPGTSSSP